jgi:hypothetical protein
MIKITFAIFILFFLLSVKLSAQTETKDSLVNERIQSIQSMLDKSKTNVNIWWYGWLGAYSAATVAQGTVYFLSNNNSTKQDMALGAATTFLGAALQALTPLNTGRDAETLSLLPDSTTDQQLKKLKTAEEFLKSNAMKEKAGRSWQIHALNEAVNLGSGLITWLAYNRTVWDGVSNFLLNSVITETQIWTQPTKTLKDYQNYCRKYQSGMNSVANKIEPEYFLNTFPGGVALRIAF